jgi:hypothetical protein
MSDYYKGKEPDNRDFKRTVKKTRVKKNRGTRHDARRLLDDIKHGNVDIDDIIDRMQDEEN